MRKSSNYNKFLEYIAFGVGGCHGDAVNTDNGVLECVAEARVEDLEGYSRLFNCKYAKMAMDSDTWLKFKVVLVNEEVVDVYYVTGSHETHIDTFVLDNFRTQKEVLSTVHQKVVEFFLNSDRFCKLEESSELEEATETEETTTHATIETIPHVDVECSNLKKVPKNCLYGMFGGFPSISEMYNDKCFCCVADRKGNECTGKETCGKTWKRYEAIINSEWHHVSLNTLANLDFDMLDTKRQKYMMIYKLARNTIKSMYKCKSITQYRSLTNRLITYVHSAYRHDRCTIALVQYVRAKIADVNLNCNVQSSIETEEFGYHESRRYN